MGSSVVVFAYDAVKGSLTPLQTISTLPAGFKGIDNSAEIDIGRTGRFLYASNRGHDSITVFAIDPNKGTLTKVQVAPSLGKIPRNFAFDPTGKYLVAGNQKSEPHAGRFCRWIKPAGLLQPCGARFWMFRRPTASYFVPPVNRTSQQSSMKYVSAPAFQGELWCRTPASSGRQRGTSWASGTGAAVQSQAAAPARSNGKPRALALIGDRYHNPDYIRVSLDKVFHDLGVPIDYTIQYDQISSALLKNYQLLLILRDGMIWPGGYLGPDAYAAYEADLETPKSFPEAKPVNWITEEQGTAIKDFVTSGNGFYALHNSSHISLSSKNYREVMGGAYIGHPPLRPFQVKASENKHPITDGISSFIVNDEQHYVTYDKDPKHVILEAENIEWPGSTEDLGNLSRFPGGLTTSARAGWYLPRSDTPFTRCGLRNTSRFRRDRYDGCSRRFDRQAAQPERNIPFPSYA